MAEDLGHSRTEAPTPRRREEARREGQVAVSADLGGGVVLLAAVLALWLGAGVLGVGLLEAVRGSLGGLRRIELGPVQAHSLLVGLVAQAGRLMGTSWGLLLATGLAVGFAQVGFHVLPGLLAPRWDRLSVVSGWGRVFSRAGCARGFLAVAKVAIAAGLAAWLVKGRVAQIATIGGGDLAATALQAWGIAARVALAVAAALVLIGLADYGFQRWRHEQALLMSRQELKEELKREEGDPLIKARLRRLMRDAHRKRALADVPRASVVVTNPTHFAIALRYERGPMAAPKVVAKGAGHLARRIVELARRHAVPVVERKPVAQALYRAVKVGDEIPPVLYQAVAEILAYVYRLRRAA